MLELIKINRSDAGRIVSTVLLCGLGFYSAIASDSPSQSGTQRIAARSQKLEVCNSESVLLEFPDWLTTVKSRDPSVIRISAVRPNCLRVNSIATGMAVLHAVDRNERQYSIEIHVRAAVDNGE